MKILMLGNGFDLAHGLPTGYKDFLKWAEVVVSCVLQEERLSGKAEADSQKGRLAVELLPERLTEAELKRKYGCPEYREILKYVRKNFEGTVKGRYARELLDCIRSNLWIAYFMRNEMYQKENWIDFESEIGSVIRSTAEDMEEDGGLYSKVKRLSNPFLRNIFLGSNIQTWVERMNGLPQNQQKPEISYKKLRDILERDLHRLIRCLEIYLTDFVEKQTISVVSPDIYPVEFDRILSFNYTDTYYNVYASFRQNITYDFIHGKAEGDRPMERNNMVLGMDEYLEGEARNQKTEFIAFKKFYQRIHKETGCIYKEWAEEIRKEAGMLKRSQRKQSELYIFGHSLDVTDKDVLQELICNDNVITTIYYVDKDRYGQQIANLVKVIGQEELIRRVYGKNRTIIFKQQSAMIPVEESDLAVRKDIRDLRRLYQMPPEDAIQLVRKVKSRIDCGDSQYFQNQRNVITVYDISAAYEITQFEEKKLFQIAKKLRTPQSGRQKFQEQEWNNYDWYGEQPCHFATAEFIERVNNMNRQSQFCVAETSVRQELEQGNLEKLLVLLEDYQIRDGKLLGEILDLVIGTLEVLQGKNANDMILKVLHRSEPVLVRDFLQQKCRRDTKSYTRLVEHIRWNYIREVLEAEELANQSQEE